VYCLTSLTFTPKITKTHLAVKTSTDIRSIRQMLSYRIAADVITQTDNGSAEFTEEEVAYITSWGYTLSKD
ncbi:MAG: hypothetical protein IIU86_03365, partial [Oscillospiraceae bacterium]|nr:hypothetical protein [Oscillospiraceae bacterium]